MLSVIRSIGIVLSWVVVIWGCFAVAFGFADLYTITLGGTAPGEPIWMGEPAPTFGQSIGEITVGVALIAFALFCRHRIRRKKKQLEVAS